MYLKTFTTSFLLLLFQSYVSAELNLPSQDFSKRGTSTVIATIVKTITGKRFSYFQKDRPYCIDPDEQSARDPKDGIESCCLEESRCYSKLSEGICESMIGWDVREMASYEIEVDDGKVSCEQDVSFGDIFQLAGFDTFESSDCKKALCECDVKMAKCFKAEMATTANTDATVGPKVVIEETTQQIVIEQTTQKVIEQTNPPAEVNPDTTATTKSP